MSYTYIPVYGARGVGVAGPSLDSRTESESSPRSDMLGDPAREACDGLSRDG